MEPQEKSGSTSNSSSPKSHFNTELEHANVIEPAMAPLILVQDTDIVSAPIITLGDDSDIDEETIERISEQGATVLEVAATTEDRNAKTDTEEETSADEKSVVYIGVQEQLVLPVQELLVDIESDAEERPVETVYIEKQAEEMAAESTTEEYLINFEEAPKGETNQCLELKQDDNEANTDQEDSLLDTNNMEECTTPVIGITDWAAEQAPSIEEDIEKPATAFSPRKQADSGEKYLFRAEEDTSREKDDIGNDYNSDEDSFQSFDSDDDVQMEAGNKKIWKELKREQWVAKDFSTILDPTTDEKVPMPPGFQARKRALLDLFMLLSRVVFFIDLGVRRERIFALIPENLWLTHFTFTDTRQLLEVRDKEICINLLSRTKTVLEEWRLRYKFPKVPETQEEVDIARTKWQKTNRRNQIEELLQIKSYKSDSWLKHIFLDFVDCLPWQDILEPDCDFRKVAVEKVVVMAELCFSQTISISEEFLEVKKRREDMRTVVREQLKDVFEKLAKLRIDE
ncbi:hypothetical protein EG329_010869 [Mollisiaceae sp. DMI_Dod_QoI]|nr:hypothetical protein EG329_010869 [Helotiales sp. DMI_Dod_QoI]